MPTVTLTWHTAGDDRVCPICVALDGYMWVFDSEFGTTVTRFDYSVRSFLVHPEFGVVWDIDSGSRAHGHNQYNCRCHVTCEFDFKDILQKIRQLHAEIMQAYGGRHG